MTREILKNHIKAVIEGIKHLDTDSAADLIAEIADEIADTSYEDAIDGAILDGIRWGYRAAVVVEMRGGAMLRAILPGGCGITHEWADESKAKAQIRAALAAARADTSQATISRLTAELEESRAGEEGALMIIASERAEVLALRRQLAEARASAAAAYERAAGVAERYMIGAGGIGARNTHGICVEIAHTIRALSTEAETNALAEMLDAETRGMRAVLRSGCDLLSVEVDALKAGISIRGEMQPGPEDQHTVEAIREIEDWIATAGKFLTARLGQRKEGGA